MLGLKKVKVKKTKFEVISNLIITILAIIVIFCYAKSEKKNRETNNIIDNSSNIIENVQDLTNSSFNEINIFNSNSSINETNKEMNNVNIDSENIIDSNSGNVTNKTKKGIS